MNRNDEEKVEITKSQKSSSQIALFSTLPIANGRLVGGYQRQPYKSKRSRMLVWNLTAGCTEGVINFSIEDLVCWQHLRGGEKFPIREHMVCEKFIHDGQK